MGALIRFLPVVAVVVVGGCVQGAWPPPQQPGGQPGGLPVYAVMTAPIYAPAPAWMFPEYLGAPLDVHFQPLQGKGTTIFPGVPIMVMNVDDFRHEKVELHDTTSFDANISAWGPTIGASAGMGSADDYRFVSYRAYDVHFLSVVDDRYAHGAVPPGAVWYPARIYWGHSYEEVCYGNKNSLTTQLSARFEIVSGGLSTLDNTSGVTCKLTGRGLRAKPGGIFAGTPDQVRASYQEDGSAPSPVFVEYRLIPGIAPPASGSIPWVAPFHVEVHYDAIHIDYQTNWFQVHYYAQGACSVNGSQVFGPTTVLNGDEGTSGTRLTTNWIASLSAAAGDRISCGLQGSFNGMAKSGPIPHSAMQPDLQIAGPGSFPGTFKGSNGDTVYTVQYTVNVSPAQ